MAAAPRAGAAPRVMRVEPIGRVVPQMRLTRPRHVLDGGSQHARYFNETAVRSRMRRAVVIVACKSTFLCNREISQSTKVRAFARHRIAQIFPATEANAESSTAHTQVGDPQPQPKKLSKHAKEKHSPTPWWNPAPSVKKNHGLEPKWLEPKWLRTVVVVVVVVVVV